MCHQKVERECHYPFELLHTVAVYLTKMFPNFLTQNKEIQKIE